MSLLTQKHVISGKHYAIVCYSDNDYVELATNIENQEMRFGLKYQIPSLLSDFELCPKGVFENQIQDNLFVITLVDYFKNDKISNLTKNQIIPTYFNFLVSKNDYGRFHKHASDFERYLSLSLLSIKCIHELRESNIKYDGIIYAFLKMNGLLLRGEEKEEVIEIKGDSLIECFNKWYYKFE